MQEPEKKIVLENQIDLIEVLKVIWAGRKTIYKTLVVFFVLGLIISFGSQKEYKSEMKLLIMDQSKSGLSGMLSQFGGLAGVNLGSASISDEMISPELYPEIIQSTPFLIDILNQKVHIGKLDTIATVYDFLFKLNPSSGLEIIKKYTIGLPFAIMKLFHSKGKGEVYKDIDTIRDLSRPLKIDIELETLAESVKERIKVTKGETDEMVLISVEMPDARVAAELNSVVVKLLTEYTINYRIQKAKADLDFITEQHKQAESKYHDIQQRLAEYQDANQGISSASARTEGERLQSEFNLAFNIYNTLSQQYEQAKIKVQEKTPVIRIIEPAKEPNYRSKPKRLLILISMLFLGSFVGIGIIFGKKFLRYN
jgi:uncharacterized protein involved in exopolysaccharide biosynthesis